MPTQQSTQALPSYPTLPAQPTYQVTGSICDHPVAARCRLPLWLELEDRLWLGTRAMVRTFLTGVIGGGYSFQEGMASNRLVWRELV